MQNLENLKKVPSSLEAEKSVLGGILLKPEALSDVVEIITPSEFYKSAHKNIYEAMIECYNNGEVIDPIVLIEKLKKMEKYEESGREQVIYDILEEVPTAANLISYAKIVKEKDEYLLVSLGRKGMTRINGEEVQRHRLKNDDLIQIGKSVFRFIQRKI